MNNYDESLEKHIRVYVNRCEYFLGDGRTEIYSEGIVSEDTKKRYILIKDAFKNGFLDTLIEDLKLSKITITPSKISYKTQENLKQLVGSVTSEIGRALVGLTVMQLSIKAIDSNQSIRLHKASPNRNSFSWVNGISMRSLDRDYVTPILRKHDLLHLNADGFMMTRSLAENYPYTDLYKAQLRGAKIQWLSIVEELENNATDPIESLKYLLSLLLNSAQDFSNKTNELITLANEKLKVFKTQNIVESFMKSHIEISGYAARLLEISMHTLLQAIEENNSLGDLNLAPLSQMRSANKKHGNIGDIELIDNGEIIEAWDAKYGKGYLREEIEEISEKLSKHNHVSLVGFVTTVPTVQNNELNKRVNELEEYTGVNIKILQYSDWVNVMYKRCLEFQLVNEEKLSKDWFMAYVLTISQRKRNIAPIDEPCFEWVVALKKTLEQY